MRKIYYKLILVKLILIPTTVSLANDDIKKAIEQALKMNYKEAISHFDKIINSTNDAKTKIRCHIWKGWIYFADKKFSLAESEVVNALNIRYELKLKEDFWPPEYISFFKDVKNSTASLEINTIPQSQIKIKETNLSSTADQDGKVTIILKKGKYTMILRNGNILAAREINISSGGKKYMEFFPKTYRVSLNITYPKELKDKDIALYINDEPMNISNKEIELSPGWHSAVIKLGGKEIFRGAFEVKDSNDNKLSIGLLSIAQATQIEESKTKKELPTEDLTSKTQQRTVIEEKNIPYTQELEKDKVIEKDKVKDETKDDYQKISSVPLSRKKQEDKTVKIDSDPSGISVTVQEGDKENFLGKTPIEVGWKDISQKTLIFKKAGYKQRSVKLYFYTNLLNIKLIPQTDYNKFSELKEEEQNISNLPYGSERLQKLKKLLEKYRALEREIGVFPPLKVAIARTISKIADIEGLNEKLRSELSDIKRELQSYSEYFPRYYTKFIDLFISFKKCEIASTLDQISLCLEVKKLSSETLNMYSVYEAEEEYFDIEEFERLYYMKAISAEQIACLKKSKGLPFSDEINEAIESWEEYDFPQRPNPNNPLKPFKNPFADIRKQKLMNLTLGICE